MKLFDFIKLLFSTSNKYEELTKYERGKNRFMIMRFMAINYPVAANMLNWNGTDPAYVNDSFRLVGKQFKSTPGWIYTRVRASKKNIVDFEPKNTTLELLVDRENSLLHSLCLEQQIRKSDQSRNNIVFFVIIHILIESIIYCIILPCKFIII